MPPDEPIDDLYSRLRKLVASAAKQARAAFCTLLAGEQEEVAGVRERASRAGEGRVRHMIATASRLDSGAARIVEPWLRRWLANETDEFARSAIAAALAPSPPSAAPAVPALEMPPHFVEAYRYAAERLCHRVRNPLTRSASLLLRLERLSRTAPDAGARADLTEVYGQLLGLFQRLGSSTVTVMGGRV